MTDVTPIDLFEGAVVRRTDHDGLYIVVGIDGDDVLIRPTSLRNTEPTGATIRRRVDQVRRDEDARGYRDGYDYGRRGMGVSAEYAETQSDEYLEGYERGYADAW